MLASTGLLPSEAEAAPAVPAKAAGTRASIRPRAKETAPTARRGHLTPEKFLAAGVVADPSAAGSAACGVVIKRCDGGFEGLFHRHDPVEAGGVQQAQQRGAVAMDDDTALVLADATDASDQSAETG